MEEYQGKNRRGGTDRRRHSATPRFPFYDSGGCLVAYDRRMLPDRRLTGMTIEWINEEDITVEFPNLSDTDKSILSAF